MRRLIARTWLLAFAAFSALLVALPALAQHGGGEESNGSTLDVVPPVLWTAAGVAAGAVIFGTLYLFKRQIGGFPEHPDWVAPIEIIPSSTLPSEVDDGHGEAHVDHHGDSAHH